MADHFFEPRTCGYNVTGETMHGVHAACAKAANGESDVHFVFPGDSLLGGYPGALPYSWNTNVARTVGRVISRMLGIPFGGGVQMASADTGGNAYDNVTISGATTLLTLLAFCVGVGSWKATSFDMGTAVGFTYNDKQTQQFSYKIDGGSPVTISPGNTNTIKSVLVTGLDYGQHTLELDSTTGQQFQLTSWVVYDPTRKQVYAHCLSLGGSRANSGTNDVNWSSQSSSGTYGLGWTMAQTWAAYGFGADFIGMSVGGNDMGNGSTPAVAIGGYANIRAMWPTATPMILMGYRPGTVTQAVFDTFTAAAVALIDSTLDYAMFDWNFYVQYLAGAVADGLIGADGTHPKQNHQIMVARALAQLLVAVVPKAYLSTQVFQWLTGGKSNIGFVVPPDAVKLRFKVCGAGGGGGSGARQAAGAIRGGGGGGSGGGYSEWEVAVSELGVSTLYLTIGGGGAGGAAPATDTAVGAAGAAGGLSSVTTTTAAAAYANTLAYSAGGAAGQGGTAAAGGAAGSSAAGRWFSGAGGAGSNGAAAGGSGATLSSAPSGGGGGGGVSAANAATAGGSAFQSSMRFPSTVAGGANTGANGSDGAAPVGVEYGQSGGGGGASTSGAGGRGGDGARGGGGGGAGGTTNGATGGRGGNGGDGFIEVVVEY